MSYDVFLIMLMAVSILTSLTVEAVKTWLTERGRTYHANALAGYVSIILSVVVSAGYVIITGAEVNAKMGVILIALVFLSWLCAMLGYDKVMQAIAQFKTSTGNGEES